VKIPDAWPRLLRAEMAARYLGMSKNCFLRQVDSGIWPPARVFGGIKVWDRVALDAAVDGAPPAGATSAAWIDSLRGTENENGSAISVRAQRPR